VEAKLGCKVISYYGSIENHYMAMASYADSDEVRRRSTGKLYPGFEARLVNEGEVELAAGEIGELQVRGPYMGAGLLNDEEQTKVVWAPGGWYRTGDLATFDQEGNIYILGRTKDVINRGGQKIIPGEIEGLLLRNPKVASVVVMGFADPVMGERACAFVVPQNGQSFTMEEMQTFLSSQGIAKYKFPEKLIVLREFPLLPGGKLNRAELRERLKESVKES
ncbi:MAG: AMP-binding protein, partial [Firmicutes bacterium]|nr:AMP-binding protein [Bacillota bacterium]